MDSKAAHAWIRKAFQEISNSSPIYSGDNLDYLSRLSPDKVKQFFKVRHNLEKRFLETPIDKSIVIDSFADVLS